jgi:radical SAM superfamily enzyme YgiQ (UPF0313 family)
MIRVNHVNREILKLLKDSGCVEVLAGLESMHQPILNSISKGTKVDDNYKITRLCKEVGIKLKALLIIGLPGENLESIYSLYKYLYYEKPDDFDLTIYTPYPNSPIWDKPEKYDITIDFDNADSWYKGKEGEYTSAVSTSALTKQEIIAWRDVLEKEFK